MRIILGSRLCQEAPFEDEFDLIEAKGKGVNEQVSFGIYITDLDKYEAEVLTMQERIVIAVNFDIIFLMSGQLYSGKKLTGSW